MREEGGVQTTPEQELAWFVLYKCGGTNHKNNKTVKAAVKKQTAQTNSTHMLQMFSVKMVLS